MTSDAAFDADVVVVGGGPAGSAAATMLARKGWRVRLYERDRFPREHVGESLLPASMPVLAELGVLPAVEAAGFLPKYGATMVWGRDPDPWSWSFRESSPRYPHAFQVVRAQFDEILLRNAAGEGVDVREGHRVFEAEAGPSGASLTVEDAEGRPHTARARFVVDASGQAGLIGRDRSLREPDPFFRNLAVYGYYAGGSRLPEPDTNNILIESIEDGWLWAIPLHTGLVSTGVVVDSATGGEGIAAVGPEAYFRERIASGSHISALLQGATLTGAPTIVRDWSYSSRELAGESFVLAGDAACFVDPLFSSGVHLALSSGVLAAAYVTSALNDPELGRAAAAVYSEQYRQQYEHFRELARLFYASNRTVDSYFWEARRITGADEATPARLAFVRAVAGQPLAVNERAVAFVQEDLREDDDNIGEEQLQEALGLFAEDYPLLVETFGAPSDVDGDGRVAVLVTHLIGDVDAGGQFRASSVLPRETGGDGNMIDLMWVNPLYPAESYRSLLAHEFQHLVNFNQHVLVRRGISEVSWLNEGLSHLAEDLVQDPHTSGNYHLVRFFLEEPGAVGLVSEYLVDSPTRGAAYLFVRSLVDLLGEGVLLRLVQTGLIDRDNVEAASGESFTDLLARWGAQLYVSGTGLSGHSRFNYRISPLQTPQGRGFPPPASVTYRLGEEPPGLAIRPRGVQFLRIEGSEAAALSLLTEPQAGLGAVALPVANAAAAAPMAADHFTGITLDPPLPLELATGDPLLVQGTTADSVGEIVLEFVPEDGGDAQRFFLLVGEGRFLRTVFFQHDEATTYSLNVYVEDRQPTPFVGRFFPIRLARGTGPLMAPTRYFNRVRLDRPLSTSAAANLPFRVSGEVDDSEATLLEFSLFPQDEDGQRSRRAETTRNLPVEAGRFDGELHFDEVPLGTYWLSLDVGQPGDLTYVGAVVNFEVLEPVTAVLEEGETGPKVFALNPNYPNPFNRGTVLSFSLPVAQASVELAVYDLLGQKLTVLVRGPRGSGFHSVAWNGRDDSGRPLASGSYLYRLHAGPYRAVGKLMLLR